MTCAMIRGDGNAATLMDMKAIERSTPAATEH
jgi:hypothetical protein